jgi:hypothetical protein
MRAAGFWPERMRMARWLVRTVAASPLGERLVLQGGTALAFVYGSPRPTRDVDFVAPPEDMPSPEEVAAVLPGVRLRRDMRASVPPFLRWSLPWEDPASGVSLALPLEVVGVRVSGVVLSRVESDPPGDPVPVRVETLDEILVDKVVACLGRLRRRGSIKEVDIFDIAYIRSVAPGIRPDPEAVARRMADYGEALDVDAVRRLSDMLASGRAARALAGALKRRLPVGGISGMGPEEASASALEVFRDLVRAF